MDLTKIARADLFAEMWRRTLPDGANTPSAGPLLPSDTTFTTVDPPKPLQVFPPYQTPASDAKFEHTGALVPPEDCCSSDDALAVARELGAIQDPYIWAGPGGTAVIPGPSKRMPYCITLPNGTEFFNCQTFIEQKNAEGVGAPYTVDATGQVHFTAASPVLPWDINNPNLPKVAIL